jgi:hypothetical protein
MSITKRWTGSVLPLMGCLAVSAGCVNRRPDPPPPPPVVVEAPKPAIPRPPPEGWFVREMESLLDLISTRAPGEPTPSGAKK